VTTGTLITAGEPAGRRVVVGHSGAGALLPAIADAAGARAVAWLAAYVPDLEGGHSMAEDIKGHRDAMFHPDWLGVDPTSDPRPLPPAVECFFILPAGDRTLRPEWMRHAARERLGIRPAEVSAGHCPHVSQPETIAGILSQA
jgi:hypothetical protein